MLMDKFYRVQITDLLKLLENQEIKEQLICICKWHGKWVAENREFEKWVNYFIKDKEIYFLYDKETKVNHGWEVHLKNGSVFGVLEDLGGLEVLHEI